MSADAETVALVVDDVMPNRKLLNSLLTRDGFRVIEAESGEAALEICRQQSVDIIFMDVMMPGIGGYEATRLIKEFYKDYFVPVILVTALDESQGMHAGIEAGADDYITKPVDAVFLRAKVTAMERIRKLHQLQYQQNQALKAIQTRIADEQRLAENIMNTAISQRMVAIDGVSSIVEPADVFSGDLVLQAKTDDDGWMVMLCDFTGHGLPAAVGTVPVTETFYSMASKGLSPESILNELNFKLKNFLPTNMFMGCIFFSYQPDQHIVRVWIGGMPTVLLKNGVSGAISHRLLSMDLPLGIIDKTQDDFHLQELSISSGDALVAYSDGLIEAENVKGHQLGMDRLENTVEDSAAEDLQAEILSAWQQFQAEGKQLDDVTLVTLNF